MNSWHSLRKGEKTATKERSGKDSRVIEWWRRESIFGKRCCKNVRTPSGKEKEDWRDFSKVGCQVFLSEEIILVHPCIPRVRVNKGGDKRPSLRRKGRSWCGERGGRGRDRYKA
jgi:hypothetical protein